MEREKSAPWFSCKCIKRNAETLRSKGDAAFASDLGWCHLMFALEAGAKIGQVAVAHHFADLLEVDAAVTQELLRFVHTQFVQVGHGTDA